MVSDGPHSNTGFFHHLAPHGFFNTLALIKARNLVLTTEAFDEVQARENSVREGSSS